MEKERFVTWRGAPATLVGSDLNVGDKIPDITLVDNELKPLTLSNFLGKVLILSTVPSLDTRVCDIETRRFNVEAANLGDEIVILTVSLDLPYALRRWCAAAGVDKVITASDYRGANLGRAFGVLIKEPFLLARTVFVIDRNGIVRHREIVSNTSEEPNYEVILAEARKLI